MLWFHVPCIVFESFEAKKQRKYEAKRERYDLNQYMYALVESEKKLCIFIIPFCTVGTTYFHHYYNYGSSTEEVYVGLKGIAVKVSPGLLKAG